MLRKWGRLRQIILYMYFELIMLGPLNGTKVALTGRSSKSQLKMQQRTTHKQRETSLIYFYWYF